MSEPEDPEQNSANRIRGTPPLDSQPSQRRRSVLSQKGGAKPREAVAEPIRPDLVAPRTRCLNPPGIQRER